MQQLLSAFVEQLRFDQRTDDTMKRYLFIADQFTRFLSDAAPDGDQRLLNATEAEVLAYLKRATTTRNGVASGHMWNQKLAAIRALFSYLMSQKIVSSDPTAALNSVRVYSKKRIPLSVIEFVLLLVAKRQVEEPYRSRNLSLSQLGYHGGLRVKELHRLDLDHLDYANRSIVNLMVKGKKFLTLTFPEVALWDVQEYLKQREQFNPAPGERALFLSERGTRLSVRQIQEIFPQYGGLAGITRRVTPHLLRHSIATEHARRGTSPSDVQKLLYHESLTTTERYMHPPDSLVEASDAIGKDVEVLLNAALSMNTSLPLMPAALRSVTVPSFGSSLRPNERPSAPLSRGLGGIA